MRSNIVFIYAETNGLHKTNQAITGYNVYLYSNLVVLNYNIDINLIFQKLLLNLKINTELL